MEALLVRIAFATAAIASTGATYRSPNFTVTAPTQEMARQVAETAEHHRRELAIAWVGHELPNWYAPCPVMVKEGAMGAGGYTSFSFDRGASGQMEVFGWNMVVQGSLERILDSVIPHEVSHTIFACHFRHPLPRWADEGAATLAEHESEKRRQLLMVNQILNTSQRIPLRQLLSMTEYPRDPQAVLSLYAQGYTLADMLVQKGGKARYLQFLGESDQLGWDRAFKKHYGFQSVDQLEQDWKQWIVDGCPRLDQPEEPNVLLVNNDRRGSDQGLVVRSQTPDGPESDAPAADSASNGRRRMLEAPKVASAKQAANNDKRYRNEGWIAIRTSGRAVPAMATSRTDFDPLEDDQSSRTASTTGRSLPAATAKSTRTIPANRRRTRGAAFPGRNSRQ